MKKRMLAWALLVCMLATLLPVSAYAEDKAAEEPTAPAGDDVPGGPQTDPVGEAISLPQSEEDGGQLIAAPTDDPAAVRASEDDTAEPAIVASGTCGADGDNLTWTLDDAGTLTVSGEGEMADWNYASYVPWYSNLDSIQFVTIGSGVTSIGYYAFCNCSDLTSITIPGSVTSIGDSAFSGCRILMSITISNNVTSIGYCAFQGCDSLTSILIPESVTSIGYAAFSGCRNLRSIQVADGNPSYSSKDGVLFDKDKTQLICCPCSKLGVYSVPDSVTNIVGHAFYCSNLTSIAIPQGVTSIGGYAFFGCYGLTSITLPGSVTSIDRSAFSACIYLTSITISEGVTSIGDEAFSDCSRLTSITLPEKVTSIGTYAFHYCSGLTNVTIPDSVTSIGEGAFIGCSGLTDINYGGTEAQKNTLIDNGWSTTENDAFFNATWHYAVDSGECGAQGDNLLWKLYDDGTLLIAGEGEMADWNYASYVPWYSNRDSIQLVTIGSGVTSIGYYAFCNCSGLTSITIPGSVTSIGDSAFSGCDALTDVIYGGTEIQKNAMIDSFQWMTYGNDPLFNATWHCETEPAIIASGECGAQGDNLLWTLDNQLVLTISGEGEMKNYSVNPWIRPDWASQPYQHVIVENGVTSIGSHAFSYSRINDIQLPETLVSIGHHAFFESMLSCINLPKNVTVIEGSAFSDCGALTAISVHQDNPAFSSLDGVLFSKDLTKLLYFPAGITGEYTVPASVTTIGDNAFYYCPGLTGITFPESVTTIGDNAFYCCTGLAGILLPNSLESIGKGAFSYCRGLTSVTIPGSVTNIDADASYYCNGLTNVTIPASVTSLGGNPFPGCEAITDFGLDENNTSFRIEDGILYDREKTRLIWCLAGKSGAVTVPEGVQSIAASAFCGCRGMTSITIPASVSSFGDCAFEGCSSLKDIYFGGSAAQKSTLLGSDPYSWANYYLRGAYWHFAGDFYGDIHSFVELKEAVAAYDGSDLYVFYNGTDTFVFEESITLPEHLYFCADADGSSVLIPEGVSLIVESETKNAFYAEELVVRGSMTVHVEALWYRRLTGRLNWVYVVDSGECGAQGDNLIWKLYNNGTLTISGEGEMTDFDPYGTPWSSHCSDIRSVIVASGVTSIGNGAFNRTYDIVYSAMTSVTIPDSVTRIEPGTFTGAENLTSFRVADGNPSYS